MGAVTKAESAPNPAVPATMRAEFDSRLFGDDDELAIPRGEAPPLSPLLGYAHV
jgi:hypothetical protein